MEGWREGGRKVRGRELIAVVVGYKLYTLYTL
jgi:hypothetical protein